MEKTVTADLIEIGCTFTPVIIMAIYGILNKDRDVKTPIYGITNMDFCYWSAFMVNRMLSRHANQS